MSPLQSKLLESFSNFQGEFLRIFASTPDTIIGSATTLVAGDFPHDGTLRDQIKFEIATARIPLYAREIKDRLEVRGVNSVSVDTTCARLRQKNELEFYPDGDGNQRGRYGLPGMVAPISPLNEGIRRIGSEDLVLIQDLARADEILRFETYSVYRRPSPPCDATYFAPYFTRNSGHTEGITRISRILGVLHFVPSEWQQFRSRIKRFAPTDDIFEAWIDGLQHTLETTDEVPHSFYFLRHLSITFDVPLLKDPGRVEGSGRDWITLMIPANRVVSLGTFFSRIQ